MGILFVVLAVVVLSALVVVALWVRRIDDDMLPVEHELSEAEQRQAQLGIGLTGGASGIGH